jgi:hypothetical protein
MRALVAGEDSETMVDGVKVGNPMIASLDTHGAAAAGQEITLWIPSLSLRFSTPRAARIWLKRSVRRVGERSVAQRRSEGFGIAISIDAIDAGFRRESSSWSSRA